jgi:hypothetical protein
MTQSKIGLSKIISLRRRVTCQPWGDRVISFALSLASRSASSCSTCKKNAVEKTGGLTVKISFHHQSSRRRTVHTCKLFILWLRDNRTPLRPVPLSEEDAGC